MGCNFSEMNPKPASLAAMLILCATASCSSSDEGYQKMTPVFSAQQPALDLVFVSKDSSLAAAEDDCVNALLSPYTALSGNDVVDIFSLAPLNITILDPPIKPADIERFGLGGDYQVSSGGRMALNGTYSIYGGMLVTSDGRRRILARSDDSPGSLFVQRCGADFKPLKVRISYGS